MAVATRRRVEKQNKQRDRWNRDQLVVQPSWGSKSDSKGIERNGKAILKPVSVQGKRKPFRGVSTCATIK